MEELIHWKSVVNALLFSGLGVAVLAICYAILEVLTPKVDIWQELTEKQNSALAIFLGALMLGLAIIIAAAVHG
jgi:uncharacterized membrane protein YjfL (UPF0719 family)